MNIRMEAYLSALVSIGLFCLVRVFRLGWKLGRITTRQAEHERRINNLEAAEFVPVHHQLHTEERV
jgi:hypothetical protein